MNSEETWDLIVLGGGSAGLGAAWAAAELGQRVLVLEAGTLAGKTSANSLRIIHGGLRYLQTGNIPRSIESIRAQSWFRLRSEELRVRALPCLIPITGRGVMRRPVLDIAGAAYRGLYKVVSGQAVEARCCSPREILDLAPEFAPYAKMGAFLWHDLVMDEPQEVANFVQRAVLAGGGKIITGFKVNSAECRSDKVIVTGTGVDGEAQFVGVQVIEALGSGFGSVPVSGVSQALPKINWIRGINLVLRRRLSGSAAWGLKKDGRYYFFVPRGEYLAVGTEYFYAAGPDAVTAPADEVHRFLTRIMEVAPHLSLTMDDLVSIDAGLLPGRAGPPSKDPADCLIPQSKIYRADRYSAILATKYTTMVEQGRVGVGKFSIE